MSDLINDIVFFQVYKKRPKGEKKIKWIRRTHKDVLFKKKVEVIKMRAAEINKKLVNY